MPDNIPAISYKILEVLKKFPEGLSIHEIRSKIPEAHVGQQHFDRRLRQLDPKYVIERSRRGRDTIYKYVGPRASGSWDYEDVSKDVQARVRHKAGGRCQMCGKTITDDRIKLHVDHKIPRTWGGQPVDENLWAICSGCNEGKRDYFSSFDPELMKQVLQYKSVHKRILELLIMKKKEWVDYDLIEFVANFSEYQEDWKKRLRELRYLGLIIEAGTVKKAKRTISHYRLIKTVDNLPDDLTKAAREFEKTRALRKKGYL